MATTFVKVKSVQVLAKKLGRRVAKDYIRYLEEELEASVRADAAAPGCLKTLNQAGARARRSSGELPGL